MRREVDDDIGIGDSVQLHLRPDVLERCLAVHQVVEDAAQRPDVTLYADLNGAIRKQKVKNQEIITRVHATHNACKKSMPQLRE